MNAVAAERPVFSHVSAAVLLGLPLYGVDLEAAHITTRRGGAGRASEGLKRHRSDVGEADVVSSGGLRFTSVNRTILDLSKDCSLETGLVAADGFLRKEFTARRVCDEASISQWRAEMREVARQRNGAYGSRRLRQVLEVADARTDSVLESISHLRLRQLGLEVALQVAVAGPHGHPYYVDFELVGLGILGECDGKSKYFDPELLGSRSPAEVLYEEKRRQDWITGREGKRLIRWGYSDVVSLAKFEQRLRAFGVPLPTRVRRGGDVASY